MNPTVKEPKTSKQFTIEADTPRNSDVMLQCIPNMRLRSRVSSNKPVIANPQSETDRPIPRGQAEFLGALPEIPGMQITVDLANSSYLIEDPLYTDEELCEKIRRGLQSNRASIPSNTRIQGLKPQEGKLDRDRFKSLCRELRWLLDADEAVEIEGVYPALTEIDKLPGHYLLNPGGRVPTSQPKYEKDYEAWRDKVNQVDSV